MGIDLPSRATWASWGGMKPAPDIACVGSALWDIIARTERPMQPASDVPGLIDRQPGGVALNIALALTKYGQRPGLLSVIGQDVDGDLLVDELYRHKLDDHYLTRSPDPTDRYMAIESQGDVFAAVADCGSLERAGDEVLEPFSDGRLVTPSRPYEGLVIVDGNLPEATLLAVADRCNIDAARLVFVPASPGKARRMRQLFGKGGATLFVNRTEAEVMLDQEFATSAEAAAAIREQGCFAIVTDSGQPVTLSRSSTTVSMDIPVVNAVRATGAGDVFLAAFVAAEARGEHDISCLQAAVDAATYHVSSAAK